MDPPLWVGEFKFGNFAVSVSLSLGEQFFATLQDNDDDNVDDEN